MANTTTDLPLGTLTEMLRTIERLQADQQDWRKGVELIASALDMTTLSCVDIYDRVLKLQAIVDRIDKTKDGASVLGDDRVYCVMPPYHDVTAGSPAKCFPIKTCIAGYEQVHQIADGYSTREAAEAAAAAKKHAPSGASGGAAPESPPADRGTTAAGRAGGEAGC